MRGDSSEAGEQVTGDGGKTNSGGRCGRRLGNGAGISHPSLTCCFPMSVLGGSIRVTGLLASITGAGGGAGLTASGLTTGVGPTSSDGKYFISS